MRDITVTAAAALAPQTEFVWGGQAHEPTPQTMPMGLTTAPDWFDAPRLMAGIKHRYLNDAARYSVAVSRTCLSHAATGAWAQASEERRGVILGTAVADYTIRHALDPQVMADGHGAINAVSAPNISANIAAAQVAITCRARAFSTTLTSPFLCGFECLYFAVQSLQLGRADAVLAMAAEESLPSDETLPVMPGSVALHLQAGPTDHGGQTIAACCWGYIDKDAQAPSQATQAFIQRAAHWQAQRQQPLTLELLRHDTSPSGATAERWRGWLASGGLAFEQVHDTPFAAVGSVDPMLHAARALAPARPVLLLAIQQRRYLAFLFSPTPPSTL